MPRTYLVYEFNSLFHITGSNCVERHKLALYNFHGSGNVLAQIILSMSGFKNLIMLISYIFLFVTNIYKPLYKIYTIIITFKN